jgi:hypothetical protein
MEAFVSKCKACGSSNINVVAVVMIVIASVGLFFVIFDKLWALLSKLTRRIAVLKRLESKFNMRDIKSTNKLQNKFKQAITLFQIMTSLPSVLSLVFPNVYTSVVSSFKIINFNFFNDLGLSCRLNSFDYVDYLLMNTICPILLCGMLLIISELHVFYVKNRFHTLFHGVANVENRIISARQMYYLLILLVLYITLPGKNVIANLEC